LIVSCNSKTSETFDEEAVALNNQATEIMIVNPDSALILLDKAIEIDPNFSAAYSNMATIFCSKGDYENAIKSANLLTKVDPDLAEAVTFLGMLYDFTGQPDNARVQYQRAIELYNKRLSTTAKNKQANRFNRAHVLLLIGDQSTGGQEVQSLLHENPDDSTIQMLVDFDKDKHLSAIFK
jgi:tetratricopeptide (TPR) repeat protein